jgi:hypothetical protein
VKTFCTLPWLVDVLDSPVGGLGDVEVVGAVGMEAGVLREGEDLPGPDVDGDG